MGMPGRVSDEQYWRDFDADMDGVGDRLAYLDGETAKEWDWADTICELQVTAEQAAAFDKYWEDLAKDPGTFSYVGDNCSTHAAEAFEAAGIVEHGIPGLDTPDGLYRMLKERYGEEFVCESGYIDFTNHGDGTWSHDVAPADGAPE